MTKTEIAEKWMMLLIMMDGDEIVGGTDLPIAISKRRYLRKYVESKG